jgi:AAA+ ATPase superfamily predicted ATPase
VTPFISVDVARAGSSVNSGIVCGMSSEDSFLGGVEGVRRRFMSTLCGRCSMSSSDESSLGLIVFVVSGSKSFSSKLLLVMSSGKFGIRCCNEAFVLLLRFPHSLSGCLHYSSVLFFSLFSFSIELFVALSCHCFLMLSFQVSL